MEKGETFIHVEYSNLIDGKPRYCLTKPPCPDCKKELEWQANSYGEERWDVYVCKNKKCKNYFISTRLYQPTGTAFYFRIEKIVKLEFHHKEEYK